jgi:hypothetical protein
MWQQLVFRQRRHPRFTAVTDYYKECPLVLPLRVHGVTTGLHVRQAA